MQEFVSWGRRVVLAASVALVLAACGGGDSDSGTASAGTPGNSSGANQAPSITGSAPKTVAVGKPYSFQPSASDSNGDKLTFSISSKPSWATFDEATGQLQGTPTAADVGSHEQIVVTVSDGKATASLPQFAITVTPEGTPGATGSATLAWQAPSTNTDGSPLMNLTGYKIHYGTEPGNYTNSIPVDTVGVTTFVVENLEAGTYYFAITAVANGVESAYSEEATKTIG